MADKSNSDVAVSTTFDPKLAPHRLKEGLVPSDTGLFLRIEEGLGASQVFTLSAGGVYVIGREGADIALEDKKVSRKHAEIGLYGPDAYVLRDLASTVWRQLLWPVNGNYSGRSSFGLDSGGDSPASGFFRAKSLACVSSPGL